MIPELGHFALALACALAFAQMILPIWGAHRAGRPPGRCRARPGHGAVAGAGHGLWLPGVEQRGR
ncbi:MAG: hypothetical protein WDN49_22550 [Acetobacteraceae bacterium]